MVASTEVRPLRISPDINLDPLIQRAFQNQDFLDPFDCGSPLSSVHSSADNSPKISPTSYPYPVPDLDQFAPETTRSRSKEKSKECRKRKREEDKEDLGAYQPPPDTKRRHVETGVKRMKAVDLDLADVRVSDNGFTGHHSDRSCVPGEYTLDQVVGPNSEFKFDLVKWDASFTLPIVNQQKKILAIAVSNPKDSEWGDVTTRAADELDRLRNEVTFTTKQRQGGRRGNLFTLNTGVVAGIGLSAPANRKQANARSTAVIKKLRQNKDFRRIAGHGSAAFRVWQKYLYDSYVQNKKELRKDNSSLEWNYSNSVFAGAAFNFGPRVVSRDHADYENRPDGFCAVTALRPSKKGYNYTKGGHLILWDLRLAIEFPPGSTILLPSAIFRHSNVAIGQDEHRMSFAQYSSGHLFRYINRRCQTEQAFWNGLNSNERAEEMDRDRKRWTGALNNFATLDDVLNSLT